MLEPAEEVSDLNPLDSSKMALEKVAEQFIQEEEDSDEVLEFKEFEIPLRPPVELSDLRYAFLNSDVETPVIISNKLSEEETMKLISVLEKHRAVLGYALQDLKGISLALCNHHIPLDPTMATSREPPRRLNNEMREVVKKKS